MPSPSYPIHIYAPLFAGAEVRQVRLEQVTDTEGPPASEAFFDNLMESWDSAWPKPRVIVLSFPHNPTTACVDLAWMQRIVDFAREHEIVLVHDFAYADIAFDGYQPPSILQVPGAKDVAVELYSLTKSFSMAGWRVAFLVGNAEIVAALTKLKSYLDYGTFQPIQIAAIVAMNEVPDYPKWVNEIYLARRDALCDGLNRIGWNLTPPKGTMFVWAPIPEPYREMGSLEFSVVPRVRGRGGHLTGRRVRPRGRRSRALRPHRERATHRPGRPQPAQDPHQAALTDATGAGRRAGLWVGLAGLWVRLAGPSAAPAPGRTLGQAHGPRGQRPRAATRASGSSRLTVSSWSWMGMPVAQARTGGSTVITRSPVAAPFTSQRPLQPCTPIPPTRPRRGWTAVI